MLCHAALIGAPAILHADPASAPHELAYLADAPVILSPARLVQSLKDAPGAVTMIDHAMIRASGARDIVELLQWVPGFQIARKTGRTPLTTYHGLSDDAPRRMLVRVDGRSASSPYFVSGIVWAKISVDIERTEVFRGSNASAYGSNAFLGIVNIVTRPASVMSRAGVRLMGCQRSARACRRIAPALCQCHRTCGAQPWLPQSHAARTRRRHPLSRGALRRGASAAFSVGRRSVG